LIKEAEADAELEGLQNSATQVQDLVLGGSVGTSSLAVPLSSVVELIEDRVDAATTNGVRWRTHSALATTVSHFPKMEVEVELLGSGHNADLTED
jgi:hypothetical protein